MALRVMATRIVSDKTPEYARELPYTTSCHVDGVRRSWQLSWLPEKLLTRDQAIAGMVLDETLSDPASVDDPIANEIAAMRAEQLGLVLVWVRVRLWQRVEERDEDGGYGEPGGYTRPA